MLKKITLPVLTTALGSMLFFACTKTATVPAPVKARSIQAQSKLMRAILKMGIKIEVTYQDGCYHSHEEYYSNGNIKSRDITCEGTCSFCKIEGVTEVNLVTNEDGNTGLPVPVSGKDNFFHGMTGKTADGSGLVFAVDRTRISAAAYEKYFKDDFLVLGNGYMLDDKAYEMLGITREQQLIPAGSYQLNQDGDLIWWYVPNNR